MKKYIKVGLLAISILVFFILLVVQYWNDHTKIIAVGSILGATISSFALFYNVIQQQKSSEIDAVLRYSEFLVHSKKVLILDVKRILFALTEVSDFKFSDSDFSQAPEDFVGQIIESSDFCDKAKRQYISGNSPVLIAYVKKFKLRYEEINEQAKILKADLYFNTLVRDVGFGALYKIFSD